MALASVVIRGSGSSFLACTVSWAFSLPILPLWSPYLEWFCLDFGVRFVAGDDLLLDLAFHHSLDIIQELVFIDADQ